MGITTRINAPIVALSVVVAPLVVASVVALVAVMDDRPTDNCACNDATNNALVMHVTDDCFSFDLLVRLHQSCARRLEIGCHNGKSNQDCKYFRITHRVSSYCNQTYR